jgi:PAS domain S-box-containing protein
MNNYLTEILNHPVDKLALLEWPSMVILDANEEFCAYFNYSKGELLDRVFQSLIWKDVPREKLSIIESEVNQYGFSSVLEEAQKKWINITKIQHGDALFGLVRVLDLPTNKKIIERELEESERRFKTLADVASEGVCFIQDGVIVDANEQLARIFIVEKSQSLFQRKLSEFLSISDIQRIMASAEISAINRNEVRATDSSGRLLFLEITGSYLRFRGKQTLALVFNDISIRKRTEQALHQSLVSFQRLLEDSPNGVVILTEGKIQYLNQAACKLFGVRDEDEVFGDAFENYLEEGFRNEVLNDLQIIREGGDAAGRDHRHIVGARDRDRDGLGPTGRCAGVVGRGDGVGQHQVLARGQVVKGLAARIEGPVHRARGSRGADHVTGVDGEHGQQGGKVTPEHHLGDGHIRAQPAHARGHDAHHKAKQQDPQGTPPSVPARHENDSYKKRCMMCVSTHPSVWWR